jgi:hypothetical protein
MRSGKLTYAGIAGAVAGVVGLLGIYATWFVIPGTGIGLNGTADISGKLALAMSVALFAFSGAYVLIADGAIRRSLSALIIVSAVLLTLSVIWGILRADGLDARVGLWLSGFGGILGIAAGILTLKESPVDAPLEDDQPAPVSAGS